MKKITLTTTIKAIAFVAILITGYAVFAQTIVRPVFYGNGALANPNPIAYQQPDGTTLTILLKGDAVINWATTTDGYTIMRNANGIFEYAVLNENEDMIPSGVKAYDPQNRPNTNQLQDLRVEKGLFYSQKQINDRKQQSFLGKGVDPAKMGGFPTTGTRKLLMILANFSNTTTTYTQANFDNYMNQTNFNGTGSFKDYYYENSYGQLTVVTTVTAWVKVPNTKTYYGPESKWAEFVRDAVNAADAAGVDFSQFDNDNNGKVDGIAVIHQGKGQEETGNTSDIWSHNWSLSAGGFNVVKDGKTIDDYTIQPEQSGTGMATIGVMCHEFGHNLGLPDFYDTNYSTGGQYDGTGNWDMMCSGSYNGSPSGAKPAHHNAWSKIYLGWATPTVLSAAANVTVKNSVQNANFYRYNTTTTNEYFLIENRQLIGFDAALPGKGMIIYHVDGNYISSHMNANDINATSRQGLYPKAASGAINSAGCPWPGTGNKTSFTDATTPNSKSWAGANTNKPITSIAENTTTKEITFAFMGGAGGTVTIPTLTTTAVSGITQTSASSGGNITADGGAAVTARGVCWATTQNPTTANSKTVDGTGTGSFTSSITGLSAGTTYYVRAYATNSAGTAYGSQVSFTTSPPASYTIPFTESFNGSTIPSGWTQANEGTGTTNRWTVSTTTNAGGTANEMKCTYQQVNPATTRLITPPINTTGYSSLTLSFKHMFDDYGAGATLKIQTSNNKTTWTDASWSLASTSNTNIGPATVTVNLTNNLNNATTYVAFVVTGNLYQIDAWYIDNVSITGPTATVPTLTTTAASSIAATTAVSGGNITADGGAAVTARGVCWATTQNPTIANSKTVDGSGTGAFTSSITGLTANTTYYVRAYATNSVGTAYGAQISFTTAAAATVPTVTTTSASSITQTTATSGGNVTSDGGAAVTARGVCWSTATNPTIANSKTVDGSGTGAFTSSITGLTANTTYYVRAYATNSVGTAYGSQISFTTTPAATIPTITTTAASSITQTTATSGGNVTSDGGAAVTARGVCWATTANPTIANSKTVDGSGTGTFTSSITGLTANTTYYVRAYATNSVGTAYGSQISFTTAASTSASIPFNEAFSGSTIPTGWSQVNEGTGVTDRWTISTTTNAGGAANEMKCTYQNINPATARLVTPAINTTGYTSLNLSFKHMFDDYGAGATLKIQTSNNKTTWTDAAWSLSSSSNTNIGPATVNVTLTNNLNNPTTYVAFVVTGNLYQIDYWYIDNVSITAVSASLPTLSTTSASSITSTSANSGGNITSDGGATVTARGVCWATTTNPTIANSKTVNGTGTGSFTSNITGLTPGTTYYVRAYATNSVGTAYGAQISFTTTAAATIPTVTTTAISSITSTSAAGGGNVTSDGGATVTARGVCWSTSANPTIANSKTVNGTGTGTFTSSLTGLASGTTYYVRAYATNSVGTAYGSQVSFTTTAATTYCSANGSNVSYEWIDLVQLGSINNTTTASSGGYGNYTAMSTNLTRGSSYTIYFSAGFSSTVYTEYFRIWIDYNKNGVFTDAGELIVSGSVSSAGTFSATFTVPTGATLGSTRLRVLMSDNSGTTSSCGTFTYGEVEDYTVNIVSAKGEEGSYYNSFAENSLGDNEVQFITLYPNPAHGYVEVAINSIAEPVNIKVCNLKGIEVLKTQVESTVSKIDISKLDAGVYTLWIDNGEKISVKKLVVY